MSCFIKLSLHSFSMKTLTTSGYGTSTFKLNLEFEK